MNKSDEKKPVFQHCSDCTKRGYLNYHPELRQWVITTNPTSGGVLASYKKLCCLLDDWHESRTVEDCLTEDQLRVFKAWVKGLGCPETDYRMEEYAGRYEIVAGSSLCRDVRYRLDFPI